MAEIPNITHSDSPIRNRDSAPCEAAASAVDDEPFGVDEAPEDSLGDGSALSGPGPARWIWQGKMLDAFWKAATLFSFAINLGLVIALIALGLMVFRIKQGIARPLITGLHTNFVQMDAAHVVTSVQVVDTIHVNDTLPVVFDPPLSTNTTVTLKCDIPIPNTTVYFNGLPAPTNIALPAGTPLDIKLDLVVPVSKTVPVVLDVPVSLNVPVNLNVPIDIPLNQTELHASFTGLANLAGPYDSLLSAAPSSWSDLFHL